MEFEFYKSLRVLSFTEILWCWSEIVSIYRRHYVAYLGVVRE